MRQIVVVGASGFGRESLDVIVAINAAAAVPVFDLLGVLDDGPSAANLACLDRRRAAYLGGLDEWLECAGESDGSLPEYVVGIGHPSVRAAIAQRFDAAGFLAATLIHPTVVLGTGVRIGAGAVVCAGALISTEVTLGRHCHVNPSAVIGHDTQIGDFVSVNPSATISGACVIRERTLIGAGAVVLQGLTVGSEVTVGAAACVTRPVPDGVIVKGVPGRWAE